MNSDGRSPQDLIMIWDSDDGEEIVIYRKDYINFCRNTSRNFWGFIVTEVEIGKSRSECCEIETYTLNSLV